MLVKIGLAFLMTITCLTTILAAEAWCSFSPIASKYIHQITHINQKEIRSISIFIQFLYKRLLGREKYMLAAEKYLNLLLFWGAQPTIFPGWQVPLMPPLHTQLSSLQNSSLSLVASQTSCWPFHLLLWILSVDSQLAPPCLHRAPPCKPDADLRIYLICMFPIL